MISEYKIGDTFNYKGIKLKVEITKRRPCIGCYFYTTNHCPNNVGHCFARFRTDHKNVIFKEIK